MAKEKIILEYNRETGEIYAANGDCIANWLNLEGFSFETKEASIEDLVQLRKAGYTNDEVIELRRQKII